MIEDGLDAAVVEESTAVKHSLRDALFDAHGTEHLPDLLRRLHGLALPLLAPDDGLDGRAHRPERGDGFLVFVIDDLDVDVLVRSVHGNARAFGRSGNLSMETDDRIARQSLALVSPRVSLGQSSVAHADGFDVRVSSSLAPARRARGVTVVVHGIHVGRGERTREPPVGD